MRSASYWKAKRLARKRWSVNATAKRERLRLERATAPVVEENRKVARPRMPGADLRVNIQCKGYGRIQFSATHYYGRLIGQGFSLSPKQFGRRLGEMFELWLKYPA